MGEECTVLDELMKSDKFRDFGIHASRNCFGGLLSTKRRVVIIPPPSEQKKLFAMSGQKAIEAIKQLIIPRPGSGVITIAELAKKGELVAVKGSAVYPMTTSAIGGAKIVETHSSRNGLIIVVDKMPASSGTRDVKSDDKPAKKPAGKKTPVSGGAKRHRKPKKHTMRGGSVSINIELSDNDLRREVVTVYKNRFSGGGYSYPWYYYLYGNILSYLSATDSAAYMRYYWLIKMDPYAAVGGFLMPFIKKRNYQYYPLSDIVIKRWATSSWWCNPSVRTGFSYAVYGGMNHDANMLGGTKLRITFANYFDKLSAAYNRLRIWIKSKGRNCDKFKKMSKIKKFFMSASSTESEYALYKELPETENWKAYFYFALYDYVCKHRSEFKSNLTLDHLVDRLFSNMDDVFEAASSEFSDATDPAQANGIEKFVEHIGAYILQESKLKEKLASVHDGDNTKFQNQPDVANKINAAMDAARIAKNNTQTTSSTTATFSYPAPGSMPTSTSSLPPGLTSADMKINMFYHNGVFYGYKRGSMYKAVLGDAPEFWEYDLRNDKPDYVRITKLPYAATYIPDFNKDPNYDSERNQIFVTLGSHIRGGMRPKKKRTIKKKSGGAKKKKTTTKKPAKKTAKKSKKKKPAVKKH